MQYLAKAEAVVEKLIKKDWRITFAESCTGGMVAAELVAVADASKVFDGSFVTYANEAKIQYLSVESQLIEQHGVVSEAVALSMAKGAAQQMNAQVAVGISGIAGPTGATPGKPVGMVCFGFLIGDVQFAVTKQFGTIGRNQVRMLSTEFVYDTLLQKLA